VRIAVVIPARDEAEEIAAAVESARQIVDWGDRGEFARPPGATPAEDPGEGDAGVGPDGPEIVVVDGGSLDRTAERARAAGAKVIETQPGRARQLEAGWRATNAPVVVFLHADTRLAAGCANAIHDRLVDPQVVGGAFRFRFAERSAGLRLIEAGARARSRWFGLPYGDQALFARRSVLQAMGGVPQVPLMEDLDLVRELRRWGRLALLPLPATTSARRYRGAGLWRTWWRNSLALVAWKLGIDRSRVAAWYRR